MDRNSPTPIFFLFVKCNYKNQSEATFEQSQENQITSTTTTKLTHVAHNNQQNIYHQSPIHEGF